MDTPYLKAYPAQISVNMLSELTGRDRRTISKKLEDLTPVGETPNGKVYCIRAALRMIFDFNPADDNQKATFESADFQPAQEKAKLDFVKRQAMELELEIQKKTYVHKDEIQGALENVFASCRAKVLSITKRASIALGLDSEKEAVLRELVKATLVDLSEEKFNERDE